MKQETYSTEKGRSLFTPSAQVKIVIATDFSEASENALEYAHQLFLGRNDLEVSFVIVHGFKPMVPYTNPPTPSIPVLKNDELEIELRARMDKIAEALEGKAHVTTYFEQGPLNEVMPLVIEKEKPDFIVMGSREKTAMERMTIGSNTMEVAMKQNYPVLAVPKEAKYNGLRHIVLASDFEPLNITERSFEALQLLTSSEGSKLTVVHVYNSGNERDHQEVHRKISDLIYEFKPIIHKNTYEGIAEYIEETHPQLVVAVPRDRGFFEGIFHSSITEKIVSHARTPILILR